MARTDPWDMRGSMIATGQREFKDSVRAQKPIRDVGQNRLIRPAVGAARGDFDAGAFAGSCEVMTHARWAYCNAPYARVLRVFIIHYQYLVR